MLKLMFFLKSRLTCLTLLFLYRVLLKRSKIYIEFYTMNNETRLFDIRKGLTTNISQ